MATHRRKYRSTAQKSDNNDPSSLVMNNFLASPRPSSTDGERRSLFRSSTLELFGRLDPVSLSAEASTAGDDQHLRNPARTDSGGISQ
jgi:hypothetical protein